MEQFTFHEGLLGLTYIVAMADGIRQTSEIDASVQMLIHEEIGQGVIEDFQRKYDRIGSLDGVFDSSVKSLSEFKIEKRAKAVAWMWTIAMISSDSTGELDYVDDVWKSENNNVGDKERTWLDKAKAALEVTDESLRKVFEELPAIRRI